MNKHRFTLNTIFAAVGLAAVIQATPALATIISDGTFNNTDWTATVLNHSGPPVSFSAVQVSSGGNPGEYRQLQQSYGGPGSLITGHIFHGAQYDPATQGAISSVSYSFDLMLLNGGDSGTVGYGSLLFQGGSYYLGGNSVLTTIEPVRNLWVHHDLLPLFAGDFLDVSGSGAHPDFSATGSPILFGYYGSNGTGISSPTSTLSGIDNWSANVTQVPLIPEPTSVLLIVSGLGVLAARRALYAKSA
jgi:hypothetical protein